MFSSSEHVLWSLISTDGATSLSWVIHLRLIKDVAAGLVWDRSDVTRLMCWLHYVSYYNDNKYSTVIQWPKQNKEVIAFMILKCFFASL